MKKAMLLFTILFFTGIFTLKATQIIVDKNGAGQYTSIQVAINAASNNDTVSVWPGVYMENLTIGKNIVLKGSGYENTFISSISSNTITMSNGKVLYFTISAISGNGINLTGGTVANCVIRACQARGIFSDGGSTLVINCVIVSNSMDGVLTFGGAGTLTAINCISRNNTGIGFHAGYNGSYNGSNISLNYSDGSYQADSWCNVYGLQGILNVDPSFPSSGDYHVTQGTPCWDAGHPTLFDPDGTRSDMGYFGGPDAPIYPVVYEMTISPNGSNINVNAKARANY